MNPDFENFWDWSTIKIQNNQTIKTRVLLLMKQESIHNPKNLSEMMFYTFYAIWHPVCENTPWLLENSEDLKRRMRGEILRGRGRPLARTLASF